MVGTLVGREAELRAGRGGPGERPRRHQPLPPRHRRGRHRQEPAGRRGARGPRRRPRAHRPRRATCRPARSPSAWSPTPCATWCGSPAPTCCCRPSARPSHRCSRVPHRGSRSSGCSCSRPSSTCSSGWRPRGSSCGWSRTCTGPTRPRATSSASPPGRCPRGCCSWPRCAPTTPSAAPAPRPHSRRTSPGWRARPAARCCPSRASAPTAVQQQLRELLGSTPAADIATRVERLSDGIPFVVEELVAAAGRPDLSTVAAVASGRLGRPRAGGAAAGRGGRGRRRAPADQPARAGPRHDLRRARRRARRGAPRRDPDDRPRDRLGRLPARPAPRGHRPRAGAGRPPLVAPAVGRGAGAEPRRPRDATRRCSRSPSTGTRPATYAGRWRPPSTRCPPRSGCACPTRRRRSGAGSWARSASWRTPPTWPASRSARAWRGASWPCWARPGTPSASSSPPFPSTGSERAETTALRAFSVDDNAKGEANLLPQAAAVRPRRRVRRLPRGPPRRGGVVRGRRAAAQQRRPSRRPDEPRPRRRPDPRPRPGAAHLHVHGLLPFAGQRRPRAGHGPDPAHAARAGRRGGRAHGHAAREPHLVRAHPGTPRQRRRGRGAGPGPAAAPAPVGDAVGAPGGEPLGHLDPHRPVAPGAGPARGVRAVVGGRRPEQQRAPGHARPAPAGGGGRREVADACRRAGAGWRPPRPDPGADRARRERTRRPRSHAGRARAGVVRRAHPALGRPALADRRHRHPRGGRRRPGRRAGRPARRPSPTWRPSRRPRRASGGTACSARCGPSTWPPSSTASTAATPGRRCGRRSTGGSGSGTCPTSPSPTCRWPSRRRSTATGRPRASTWSPVGRSPCGSRPSRCWRAPTPWPRRTRSPPASGVRARA